MKILKFKSQKKKDRGEVLRVFYELSILASRARPNCLKKPEYQIRPKNQNVRWPRRPKPAACIVFFWPPIRNSANLLDRLPSAHLSNLRFLPFRPLPVIFSSISVFLLQMSEAPNEEITLDVVNDVPEVSTEKKRTREWKLRSKAWDHFTKLIQEDGTAEKCQCNHCHKLFTCAGKTGTTHLLRHITEGTCPVYNTKEKKERPLKIASSRRRNPEPKYDQGMGQTSQQYGLQDDVLPLDFDDFECQATESVEGGEYLERSPMLMPRKLPQQPRGESWMNEVRACVGRLAELTNVAVPNKRRYSNGAPPPPPPPPPPDYSLAAAVRCLNEMEDIPQSSEMYLDAFDVLKDEAERECFICLPQEPRRRWLQRTLLRHFPLRYNHES